MTIALRLFWVSCVASLITFMGCSSNDSANTAPNSTDVTSMADDESEEAPKDVAFALGDLIPEFIPQQKRN